jgi:STE24 endopeptidase
MAAWSRRHEFQADAFAARNSDARSLAEALVVLYRDNASTLTPDPVHSAFYDSHPPPAARIERLNALLQTAPPTSSAAVS